MRLRENELSDILQHTHHTTCVSSFWLETDGKTIFKVEKLHVFKQKKN